MTEAAFTYSQNQFKQMADEMLRHARAKGASDAVVEISEASGLAVSVRQRNIDTIEQNRDKGIGITVYLGQRHGNASTSDFSQLALLETVDAAYNIARFTAEDDCAGLPEADAFERHPRDLQLYYPWTLSAAEAIELALRCETAAFAVDPRISNSEGAAVQTYQGHFLLANSRGFCAGYPHSRHTISVAPIASIAGKNGAQMQRDDWYSSKRNAADLAPPEVIGAYAAERALARLNARRLDTRQCPVLFEAPLAAGILGSFVYAVSGGALYRKATFMQDSLGQAVFAPHIQIAEDPYVIAGMGSAPFDEEGVTTHAREVVRDGVLQGYFLSTYSARKLKLKTTGNAGGSHNIQLTSRNTQPGDDLSAMLRKMDTGLLVTELMGQGVNYITGDYSRGVSGFWVERGVIQYPVEEITIAGHLGEMFRQIVAVGSDVLVRGSKQTGSILIERMTVAGN